MCFSMMYEMMAHLLISREKLVNLDPLVMIHRGWNMSEQNIGIIYTHFFVVGGFYFIKYNKN